MVNLEPCVVSIHPSFQFPVSLQLFALPPSFDFSSNWLQMDSIEYSIALKRDRQRSNEIRCSVERREMIPNIASERFLRARPGPAHPSVHVANAPGTEIENTRILREQDQIVDMAVTAGKLPFRKAGFRASFAGICADDIASIDGQDDEARRAGDKAADDVDERLLKISNSLARGTKN